MITKQKNGKQKLYILIIILALASLAFRVLNKTHLEQTSILFVGLPTLITLLVIKYMTKPKNLYGITFRIITLFLLICSILFGEGLICIIIMAPIFYGTGAFIVAGYNRLKGIDNQNLKSVILLPLILILLQPQDIKTTPKINSITTKIIVDKKISLDSLNKTPNFLEELPGFFKIGFPKPISIQGTGLKIGSKRIIEFESRTKGVGELVLEIQSIEKNKVTFKVIDDKTHINHWLTWKKINVSLVPQKEKTEVVWQSDFTCDLGPKWYFEPIEKYAVKKMNEHLLSSYFK